MKNFKYVVYYNSTYENTIGSPVAAFIYEQDAKEYVERQNPTLQHRYTIMNEREEMYAKMVEYVECHNKTTRFQMLSSLDELGMELNQESVDLIEKLYADGFINE